MTIYNKKQHEIAEKIGRGCKDFELERLEMAIKTLYQGYFYF